MTPGASQLWDTPYLQAVLRLFERIGAVLPTTLSDPVRAVLVGGSAILIHTGTRVSKDVEAIFSQRLLLPQDLVIRYTDEGDVPRQVVYAYNYFSEIALMHPDFEQDAVVLGPVSGHPLVLAVLSPVDLAVSKLARFQDQDRQDIAALASRKLLSGPAFEQRVTEALAYYVGDTRWIQYNLNDAVNLINVLNPTSVHGPIPGAPQP
ncbi:MAG: DUF6036 family nucleotidyltransferase [Candidatus Competibacteraceae bacterium]|jgi:hypothetical protein|nr:DUF6036 family nucleotidyltransferase [Candidatus Competibacteraceae bacterium]